MWGRGSVEGEEEGQMSVKGMGVNDCWEVGWQEGGEQ